MRACARACVCVCQIGNYLSVLLKKLDVSLELITVDVIFFIGRSSVSYCWYKSSNQSMHNYATTVYINR